jgi:hypothetical protein
MDRIPKPKPIKEPENPKIEDLMKNRTNLEELLVNKMNKIRKIQIELMKT